MRELILPELSTNIRSAQIQDLPAIRQILHDTLAEFSFEADPKGIDQDLEDPFQAYSHADALLDVLTMEQNIIGFVGLIPLDQSTIELRKLYLSQPYRGHGLGSKLLDHAIVWARQRHFEFMSLQTSSRLHSAAQLYDSRGFAPVEGRGRGDDCDQLLCLNL